MATRTNRKKTGHSRILTGSAVGLATVLIVLGFWRPWEPQNQSITPAALRQPPRRAVISANPFGTREAVAQGQTIFARNCAVCHGEGARGEDPTSPRGGQKPDGDFLAPALNGTGHAWHHPPQELIEVIMYGSPRPGSRMVGWAGRMSEEEIRTVLAYLFAIWPDSIRYRYIFQPHH